MRNLVIGIAIGYFFSDEIEQLISRSTTHITVNNPGAVDYASTKTRAARLDELENATVEDPAEVTVEEARALAERKNISLHSVLSSGRWLISEDEA